MTDKCDGKNRDEPMSSLFDTTRTRRDFVKDTSIMGIGAASASSLMGNVFLSGAALGAGHDTYGTLPNGIKYMKVGFTYDYLIPTNDGYLLIDTSYPNKYRPFIRGLKSLDIDISEIRYLLLTHHHDDHSGFAQELVRETGAKIIVHENAREHLARGRSEDTSLPLNNCIRLLLGAFSIFHRFNFPQVLLKGDDYVVRGDDFGVLRELGIDGDILYTPGHTDDSISVLLDDGTAIVGDVAMNFLNFCNIRYRPIFIQDISEVYRSWERLREAGAKTIYPAHGDPFGAEELVPV